MTQTTAPRAPAFSDEFYDTYMVACRRGPSGRELTIEQVIAGDCRSVEFRSYPDDVSTVANVVFWIWLFALTMAALHEIFKRIYP